jgi:hypothetical protein
MTPLTHGDGQDLLERYKEAWERRSPDLALEMYAQGAEVRHDPFEEPAVGLNSIREIWNYVAASEDHVEFDAERIWVVERTVLASWHVAYTRRENSERVRMRGFTVFELDDRGLIQRQKLWAHTRVVGHDSTHRAEEGSN